MELVVLAGGIGSRFGGLKQLESMTKNNEFIIDFAIFDAIKVGFTKVYFVINEQNKDLFEKTIASRIRPYINVEYVFQDHNFIPEHYNAQNRTKPFGTAHALICCKNQVKGNFFLIGADDFTGSHPFEIAKTFLSNINSQNECAIITYPIKNFLSEFGTTKRGLCEIAGDQVAHLTESIVWKENNKIFARPLTAPADFKPKQIDESTKASLGMYCFTPKIFELLESEMDDFYYKHYIKNPNTAEFLLPLVVNNHLKSKELNMQAFVSESKWFGITYPEDKFTVTKEIETLINTGVYPNNLWNKKTL